MPSSEHVHVAFESGESSLVVRRFSIREAMSRPFEANLVAVSDNPGIALGSIVGKRAAVTLDSVADGAQRRVWNGVCSHFAQLRAEAEGVSSYLVRIVPELWLLTQRSGHRIFQRKTLVEIVEQVLGEWGIVPRLELTADYIKHDYIVQYGESDFDFVSRLLERASVSYFFDFGSPAETKLVLADEPQMAAPRKGKPRYHDKPPEVHGGEYVTQVRIAQAVRPGARAVRDFEFRRAPDYPLFGTAEPIAGAEAMYEQYDYAPGELERVDPSDGVGGATPVADDKGKVRHSEKAGAEYTQRTLEAERATRRVVRFQSNLNDLCPGVVLSIAAHPRADLAESERLLTIATVLEGAVGQRWSYGAEASFCTAPYRPVLRTPKPRIRGVQSAVVVGPPGKEIHTDEHGRVRLQFFWDRDGTFDDNSSGWVRVSQDWAGAGYGSELIPRVGQEVLVAFLDGDPDQPLVVGRVYNAKMPVPYKLPDHKTRSVWRSDSSPGSAGFNEIMFEDKAGKELVYHQAQLDMQKLTKREEIERIGADRVTVVGKNRSAVVATVDATMVGGVATRQMIQPPSPTDLKILEQQEPSLTPLDTTMQMVDSRVIFTTGKATVAFAKDSIVFEADGNITIKAKGNDVILEGARAFLNTIGPPPAPKPSAIQSPKPGTFSPTRATSEPLGLEHEPAPPALSTEEPS